MDKKVKVRISYNLLHTKPFFKPVYIYIFFKQFQIPTYFLFILKIKRNNSLVQSLNCGICIKVDNYYRNPLFFSLSNNNTVWIPVPCKDNPLCGCLHCCNLKV